MQVLGGLTQLQLEQEMRNLGRDRYWADVHTKEISVGSSLTVPGRVLMRHGIERLAREIKEHVKASEAGRVGKHAIATVLIADLDPVVLAYLSLKATMDGVIHQRSYNQVCMEVARLVEDEVGWTAFQKAEPDFFFTIRKEQDKRSFGHVHQRATMAAAAKRHGYNLRRWTPTQRGHVGLVLVTLLCEHTGLFALKPRSIIGRTKPLYFLEPTPETLDWIEQKHNRCALLNPVRLPMIESPLPWTNQTDGGFYSLSLHLVKTTGKVQTAKIAEADMPIVYSGINHLQTTAWVINRKLLSVIRELSNEDSNVGGLAPANPRPFPPWPDLEDPKGADLEEHRRYKMACRLVKMANRRDTTKRIQLQRKLWMADEFRESEELYFVWTLDFRGRAYPVVSFLNPQGDDVAKSLLKFAEGKKLGDSGVDWIRIHGANCYGEDKVSYEDRIAWSDRNHENICRCAIDPMATTEFWGAAVKPFQFLAFCNEYYQMALLPDPTTYISQLPVSVDGSCNGIQHYSAMLRDEVGGGATNLVPGSEPADLYQQVCDRLGRRLEGGGFSDEEIKYVAFWLPKISRRLVKRPVMTLPYGATATGVGNQLLEECNKTRVDYGELSSWSATFWLARILMEATRDVVIGAVDAMAFLGEVAALSSDHNLPVMWTTPIGFPIHQAYYRPRGKRIKTLVAGCFHYLKINIKREGGGLLRRKQRNGLAPNLIHSMDATHMLLVSNEMAQVGHTFVAIHDSFATHAADVSVLQDIIRNQFRDLYHLDHEGAGPLEKLCEETFPVSYDVDTSELVLPDLGVLALDKVIESEYFFN